jgi:hypothetical protein
VVYRRGVWVFAIFGGVSTCQVVYQTSKTEVEKLAWTSDPYGFP